MRLLLKLVLNALALILTAYLVPGFYVESFWPTAILAAVVLALINTFIRPLLVLLTIPLTVLTLGLFLFVVNAVVLWLLTLIVPGVRIDNFLSALLAALVLSVVSAILSMLFNEVTNSRK